MIRLRCIKTFSISKSSTDEKDKIKEFRLDLKDSTIQDDFTQLLEEDKAWEKDHFRVNEDIELYDKKNGSFVIFRFLKRFEGSCIKYELSNDAWLAIKDNFAKV